MEKDIHVVSMDVENIAVIKKNKKMQHERMRQGNARIIEIHPFVFGFSNNKYGQKSIDIRPCTRYNICNLRFRLSMNVKMVFLLEENRPDEVSLRLD